jgi:hypothetical protein
MHTGIHVNHLVFLSDFNETWIFRQILDKKYSNIKFRENPFSGSRVVPGWRTDSRHDEAKSGFSKFWERGLRSILKVSRRNCHDIVHINVPKLRHVLSVVTCGECSPKVGRGLCATWNTQHVFRRTRCKLCGGSWLQCSWERRVVAKHDGSTV